MLALYWGSNLKGAPIPQKGSILVLYKYACFKVREDRKVHLWGCLVKNKHVLKCIIIIITMVNLWLLQFYYKYCGYCNKTIFNFCKRLPGCCNRLFILLPSGKRFRSMMAKTERLRRSFFPQGHQSPKLKLGLITFTRLNLINCKTFIILHHPYCCYVYIPGTTCLHIPLAHPCSYYYLLSPQYSVLHILFHCSFYSLFLLFLFLYLYSMVVSNEVKLFRYCT